MSGMGHAGTSRRIQRFFACLVRRPTGLIRFSPLSCRSGQVFVQWSWSSVRFVCMPWLQVYIYTSPCMYTPHTHPCQAVCLLQLPQGQCSLHRCSPRQLGLAQNRSFSRSDTIHWRITPALGSRFQIATRRTRRGLDGI